MNPADADRKRAAKSSPRRTDEGFQGRCQFGVARADITPPTGIYHRMWGAAKHEQSTGVHRPLLATAIAMRPASADSANPDSSDAQEEQLLVALDHCLLWADDMNALLQRVSQQADVPLDRLLVTFSHTHAAGLMDSSRSTLPGGDRIEPYLQEVAATVAWLIGEARRNLRPATLTAGYGRCDLARHRDFWDEQSGQFVCGYHPDGWSDDTLTVVRVTADDTRSAENSSSAGLPSDAEEDANAPGRRSEGATLATLVNYACHPTTLAWDNTLISPDFIGALRDVVETQTSAPCVFLQGASGDLGPKQGFVGDLSVADRNGRQVGFAALSTSEGLPPPGARYVYAGPVVSGATIGTWRYEPWSNEASQAKSVWRRSQLTVEIPYRQGMRSAAEVEADRVRLRSEEEAALAAGDLARARDLHALVERADRQKVRLAALPPGERFPFPIVLWRVGDVVFVGVEAEHYQQLQVELRRRRPDAALVVTTLCNGSRPSYLPTRDAYGKGIYQETVALLEPGCLEAVIDATAAEIDRLMS